MTRVLGLGVAVLALGFVSACESILDIRDARVDPSLTMAGDAGVGELPRNVAGTAGDVGGAGGEGTAGVGGLAGEGFAGAATAGRAGAGHGGATAGNAGAAGQGGSGGEPTLCDQYCGLVMKSCTDDYAVYTNHAVCMAVCETFEVGEAGAQTGNSLHCRLRAAKAATIEIPFYCPIAGPGGNGTCGSDCEGLCHVFQSVCVGDNAAYANEAMCLDQCKKLKNLGTYTVALSAEQHGGNHVQCRLYHVSAAATNPDEHCSHASGAPPCASP